MHAASAHSEKSTISGPAGDLELLIDVPGGARRNYVAVVCHPHPLFGGTMHNKVAHILARACNDVGASAVRFNFRGVGASQGVHDDGRGEVDDVIAVLAWAEQRWPGVHIWLAGFSFGAAMALRTALRDARVARLVTVAPALRWLQGLHDDRPSCRWLIVQGDRDELVDASEVRRWAAQMRQPPELAEIEGAEHFFHGRLTDLRQIVATWLQA